MLRCQSCSLTIDFSAGTANYSSKKKAVQPQSLPPLTLLPDGPLMVFVPEQGPSSFVIKAIVSWVKRVGYAKFTFQHDQESSLRSLAEQVQRELGHAHAHVQAAPRYSHASQGSAENTSRLTAGMLRTCLSAFSADFPLPQELATSVRLFEVPDPCKLTVRWQHPPASMPSHCRVQLQVWRNCSVRAAAATAESSLQVPKIGWARDGQ